MSKGWVISRGIRPSHELSIREVVTLRATLGAQNDEWLLSRQNDASSDISTAAILSKPEWCPEPWPFDADTEADDLLVQLAALKKFAIFFGRIVAFTLSFRMKSKPNSNVICSPFRVHRVCNPLSLGRRSTLTHPYGPTERFEEDSKPLSTILHEKAKAQQRLKALRSS